MRIDEIKPYPRNARRNAEAVPKVAESIKAFGFRGQIVLRSHDDPTIVCGHTRVEALKLLGWDEIPDEHVQWCDDLSDDEVKALRIADNKTGDIAKYNISMLKSEVKSLRDFDMSRFGVDFKSKARPYGAERLRTDGAYNLHLVSRDNCPDGMPAIEGADVVPERMVGFNYAKSATDEEKRGAACHFFVDDYQFERVWSKPERYVEYLRGFDCVLTPDFSLYMDMPDAMQAWNRYRSQALGLWWQRSGLVVVPTLSWAQRSSYAFCFDGVPRHATVAVSTVGVKGDEGALEVWRDGMREAMRRLEPARVLLYGGDVGFDFGGCEVVEYDNDVTERMGHGR